MKLPEEIQVILTRPLSCAGRVIPAALAPISVLLSADNVKQLSDISSADWASTLIAAFVALLAGVSGWLSTGASVAREQIKNGTEVAKV